jgi:transposase
VYSKSELIRLYKKETNLKVKERLLLVIKVEHDNFIPAYAADELHRSRPWALYWLDRFSEEGLEGLRDRTKSGRPPDISEETIYEIKNELASSKQGWTTKQVEDLIIRKSGGRIRYHYTHIYRLMHKWGFKQKVPRKIHVNTVSKEEKERFKKEPERYYWILSKKKSLQ